MTMLTLTKQQLEASSIAYIIFSFNNTSTTEIYTLSLHDALPISHDATVYEPANSQPAPAKPDISATVAESAAMASSVTVRSEEHTSELQSQSNLVCRLLLEKKKQCLGLLSIRHTNARTTIRTTTN